MITYFLANPFGCPTSKTPRKQHSSRIQKVKKKKPKQ